MLGCIIGEEVGYVHNTHACNIATVESIIRAYGKLIVGICVGAVGRQVRLCVLSHELQQAQASDSLFIEHRISDLHKSVRGYDINHARKCVIGSLCSRDLRMGAVAWTIC